MFAILALIFFVAWIFGFVVFHVSAALIHLLLVVALISIVWHLFSGRRTA